MRSIRSRTLRTLTLAGALAVAGCGDDDDNGVTNPPPPPPPPEENVTVVQGDVENDTTWEAGSFVALDGPVFVGTDCGADGNAPDCNAVTLTIEPGVTVYGAEPSQAGVRGTYLVVSRGSEIIADANANVGGQCAKPAEEDVIVFTSPNPPGQRARGDWGGLVLNGQAPINTGAEAEGEGDSGLYGGPDENDTSGILRGVRVEFAGDDVTEADQLNGIAFQGVGAGTTVCYVQVAYNVDDGTEPFGGTVSQTHMVTTGIGDDSFDGTDGYRGFLQFGIIQQRADDADQGFELSNNGDTPDAGPPFTTAVVANVTAVGAGVDLGSGEIFSVGGASGGGDVGLLQREGSSWRVYNTIITGFGDSGFDVEGSVAAANADARLGGSSVPEEILALEGSILWMNADDFADASGDGYSAAENETFFTEPAFENMIADPGLPDAAFDIGSLSAPPDFVPTAMPGGYTAVDVASITAGLVMPTDGRRLENTTYAGAVEPGTSVADAWYSGWTIWSTDGSDSRPGLDEVLNP